MMKNNYQVAVIGSGPGGALTALNLLESGFNVLLIEKGGFYKINEIKHYSHEEMCKKYSYSGLTLAVGNPNINYVEGSCFGGGSEVNSGLYHRLPKSILNEWRSQFKIEYSDDKLNQIYLKIEKDLNICFSDKNQIPEASLKLLKGSEKTGLKCVEVPRWVKYEKNILVKQSMSETYLKKYMSLGGEFILNSEVLSFSKNSSSVVLKVKTLKKIINIKINYLFICSGAIQTPFLLMKSGIKKNIGNTLKMHPSFKFIAKYNEKINALNMGVPVHQIKCSHNTTIGCSISNKAYLGVGLSDSGNFSELNNWERMASYYVMISPESYGQIYKLPFIESPIVRYRLSGKDINTIYDGIRKLNDVLFDSGAIELYPSVNSNLKIACKNDYKKIKLLGKKRLNLMSVHLFSSLRMSGLKNFSATNPYGQLWKHKNIFVNDSSILCDSPGINPQGTIMAFSKYNVDHFVDNYKKNEF